MFNKGFPVLTDSPDVQCTAFEDNSGALEMAHLPKMRPRTKHLNIALHHFREMVRLGELHVHAISTLHQLADMLTKPLPQNILVKHRLQVNGK